MKVAIFGNTLYAGVMSALLSEAGHFGVRILQTIVDHIILSTMKT